MKKAELHKDFKTGDITIVIPEGIKLRGTKLGPNIESMTIKEILITEELIEDYGRHTNDKRFILDIK